MRKKTHLFLLLFCVALPMYVGAQSRSDSLKQALQEVTSDSLRVKLLVGLSTELQYSNIDQAHQYASEAISIAESKNWDWALAESNLSMAFLGTLMGDYTTALKHDNRCLQAVRNMNDSVALAKALNNVGQDYSDLGEFDDAYYYLTTSYKVARLINDSLYQAVCLFNLGHVFKELGQFDIALNHFTISSQISARIGDLDGEAYIGEEVGSLYLKKKDFLKADASLSKALQLTRERKLTVIEPRILVSLAELNLEEQYYDISLHYYDTASQHFAASKNQFGIASTKLGKGKVLAHQKKFEESFKLVQEALVSAKALHARILERDCYEQLSALAEQRGDYKKSLEYFKNFKAMRDSLYGQEFVQKLFEDLRYESQTKDSEIAELSLTKSLQAAEMKRQGFIRNILAVSAALTGIVLLTVYRSGRRRIRINKLLMEHQEEIKRRSIELEQLNQVKDKFFSIISHDLRSPINALSGILSLMDKDQIKPEEFSRLAKELRVQFNHTKTLINNLLDWALLQMDKLKIQPEKIDLRTMVDENFRLLSSLHLKETEMINQVPEQTYALADRNTLNLVFRNLILNSIKFTENGGRISVGVMEGETELTVCVTDNGVGIAPEIQSIIFEKTTGYSTRGTANEKGTGLGLILCKEFVERNGGKIRLQSEVGKGTTFSFTLNKA